MSSMLLNKKHGFSYLGPLSQDRRKESSLENPYLRKERKVQSWNKKAVQSHDRNVLKTSVCQ